MKKILIIVTLVVVTLHLFAQPVWQWQNPSPPMSNYRSISMIDTTEGWLTVGTNSLMHYINGQWDIYTVPSGVNMINPLSILFLAPSIGWVGCENGIFKYNGNSWQKLMGSYCVTDMFFFNQNSGWATEGYSIAKITGSTVVSDSVSSQFLRALYFPDSLHGWAVGDSGTIMSYYGGVWYNWPSITNQRLNDVYFTDLYHGWAVGDSGTVLFFNGTNWQIQYSGVSFELLTLDFTDLSHGFAAGYGNTIISYNGTSWSFYCTTPSYVLSLDMVNTNRGFASCYMGVVLDVTTSVTMSISSTSLTYNEIDAVCFPDINHGWAVGADGTVLKYFNGNWGLTQQFTNASLFSVHFPDKDHGWAVGQYGIIVNYENGNWNGQFLDSLTNLYGVYFVDSLNGWAVGQDGLVLHYHNHTWIEESSNTDTTLLSVFFTDTTNGWAVGTYGNIMHYTNGVWQHYNNNNQTWLNSVFFTSPSDGWAVGDSGFIWHYNGIDWQINDTVAFAPWKIIRSVYFTSPDNGWIVGSQSLYHYNGLSWTDYSYTLPSAYQFYSISFPDELNGWIVGGYGSILYCEKPNLVSSINFENPKPEIFDDVYPNPCDEKCFYEFENTNIKNIKLTVYGLSGQEYVIGYSQESSLDKIKLEIDVSNLNSGLYFLSINTGENIIVKKIIRK